MVAEGADKAEMVRDYALHTSGTEEWHKHWLGMLYTDGIKHLADTCGAHWLLDLVASHQPDIRVMLKRAYLGSFQVWRIRWIDDKFPRWIVDCWSDTPGGNPPDEPKSVQLVEQTLEFTDFPKDLSGFEFWVEGDTMLLKAEH